MTDRSGVSHDVPGQFLDSGNDRCYRAGVFPLRSAFVLAVHLPWTETSEQVETVEA
jgi:hypothetical protein